ncbi:MAG TPA: DNA-formamidopyrimidine glycosylase family protein [Vicinamibacterales bacterium]|jgi:endonuclease-8
MPEGDAIFRTARTLNGALAGRTVVRFESVFPQLTRVHDDVRITGRIVESVTAAGKHVLMRFSDDLTLRTHMRMNGSWHVYRPGERWRKPRRDMRIVVATASFEAVAFAVLVAEFLDSRSEARQDDLRKMGPDLLGASFDEDEALCRIRERNDEDIADVLLNQRAVAGIGNVYKCETLFLCRVSPFAHTGTLTDDTIRTLLRTARKYLLANVNKRSGGIVTYAGFRRERGEGARHYAYARAGRACRRCGTAIQLRAQGPHARRTYWCPACQPSGE